MCSIICYCTVSGSIGRNTFCMMQYCTMQKLLMNNDRIYCPTLVKTSKMHLKCLKRQSKAMFYFDFKFFFFICTCFTRKNERKYQAWIECGSRVRCSQEIKRKIYDIITLMKLENEKEEDRKKKEKDKKGMRGEMRLKLRRRKTLMMVNLK